LTKISLIYVFHVSIWGLGALFGEAKPTKARPWRRDWMFCGLSLSLRCRTQILWNAKSINALNMQERDITKRYVIAR